MTVWELIYCGSGLVIGSLLGFLLYAILRVGSDADNRLDWYTEENKDVPM